MRIVIGGGGKIGFYLAKTLLPFKHDIKIIENDWNTCRKLADDLDVSIINGNTTELEYLKDAELEDADVFIAVTNKDEENLIACQLAKRKFGVKRTIAKVSNPQNIKIFEKLGVDVALSTTSMIAEVIEQEIDFSGMKTLMKLKQGDTVINEITLNDKSPVINQSLIELDIPKNCILISVIRNEEVIIPNGFTVLKAGDFIIAITSSDTQEKLKNYFLGTTK